MVEFVEILAKNEFTEFEGFATNFLLVPSRLPRSLPAWQRWQGPQRGSNVCELLHA